VHRFRTSLTGSLVVAFLLTTPVNLLERRQSILGLFRTDLQDQSAHRGPRVERSCRRDLDDGGPGTNDQ
jgi:hypothetical protein